jgi:hypothetical protein
MAGITNDPGQSHYYLRFDKINDFVENVGYFYIRKRNENSWWKVTHLCAKVGVALQIPFLLVESVACHVLRSAFHFTLGVFTLDYRQFIYGIIDLLSLVVEAVALPLIGLCFFFSTSKGEDTILESLMDIDNSAPNPPDDQGFSHPPNVLGAGSYHPIALREIFSRDSKAFKVTQGLLLLFSYPKVLVDLSSQIVRFPLLGKPEHGLASLIIMIISTVGHFVRPFLPIFLPTFLPNIPHGLRPGEIWAVDKNIYSYSVILGLDIDSLSGKRAPILPSGAPPRIAPQDHLDVDAEAAQDHLDVEAAQDHLDAEAAQDLLDAEAAQDLLDAAAAQEGE